MPIIQGGEGLETRVSSGDVGLRPVPSLAGEIAATSRAALNAVSSVQNLLNKKAAEREEQADRVQGLQDLKLRGETLNRSTEQTNQIGRDFEAGDASDADRLDASRGAVQDANQSLIDNIAGKVSEEEFLRIKMMLGARGIRATEALTKTNEAAVKGGILVEGRRSFDSIAAETRGNAEGWLEGINQAEQVRQLQFGDALPPEDLEREMNDGLIKILGQGVAGALDREIPDYTLARAIANSAPAEDALSVNQVDALNEMINKVEHEQKVQLQKEVEQANTAELRVVLGQIDDGGRAAFAAIKQLGDDKVVTPLQESAMRVRNQKNREKRFDEELAFVELAMATSNGTPVSERGIKAMSSFYVKDMMPRWAEQEERGGPTTFWQDNKNLGRGAGYLPSEAIRDMERLLEGNNDAQVLEAAVEISSFAKILSAFPDDANQTNLITRANVIMSSSRVMSVEAARQRADAIRDSTPQEIEVRRKQALNELPIDLFKEKMSEDIANVTGFFGGLADGSFSWWGGTVDVRDPEFDPEAAVAQVEGVDLRPGINRNTVFPDVALADAYRVYVANFAITGDTVAATNIAMTGLLSGAGGYAVDTTLQGAMVFEKGDPAAFPIPSQKRKNVAMKNPPAMATGYPPNFISKDIRKDLTEVQRVLDKTDPGSGRNVFNEVDHLEHYIGGDTVVDPDTGRVVPTYTFIDRQGNPLMGDNEDGEARIIRYQPPFRADYLKSEAVKKQAEQERRNAEARFRVETDRRTDFLSAVVVDPIFGTNQAVSIDPFRLADVVAGRFEESEAGQRAFDKAMGVNVPAGLGEGAADVAGGIDQALRELFGDFAIGAAGGSGPRFR